jgi:hypothetical protein
MNDLGPASAEPSPVQATNLGDLAECLRQLHVQADKPSCRELERHTETSGGLLPGTTLKRVVLRRNRVNQMLRGSLFPGKAFMLTFVEQCGVDLRVHPEWRQAWDRLAWLREHEPAQFQGYERAQQARTDVHRPTEPNAADVARVASDQMVAAELGTGKASARQHNDADEAEAGTRDTATPPSPEDSFPRDTPRVLRSTRDPWDLASTAAMLASIDPDEAEELARSISDPRWKASALTNIAGAVAASDPARAERLAQSITEMGYRTFARAIVATALVPLDPDRAERLAQSITNKTHKALVLATVAGTLAAWNPERAERLAQSITDERQKGFVLATVAGTLAACDPDRAERLAHSITDRGWEVAAIANIAGALMRWDAERAIQLIADAKEVAESISDERWRAWTSDYIARVQQRPNH